MSLAVDKEAAYCLRLTQAYGGERKQCFGSDRGSNLQTGVGCLSFQEAMYLMLDPEKVGLKLEVDGGTIDV